MIEKSKIKNQKSKLQIKVQNFEFCIVILSRLRQFLKKGIGIPKSNFSASLLSGIFAFCILHFNCYAQSVSSVELINNARFYDGKIVTYEGEVIGDIMVRGEYAWINVNDGQNAIGIWIEKSKTLDILYTGNYKSKGDWIEITGIFQRACPAHGGDLDLHAQKIRKVRSGRMVIERCNLTKRNLALVLLGVLCLVWILKQLKGR